jgi:hypothetical protein
MARCLGPEASAVMKGRLMSVDVVLLSSHLACSVACDVLLRVAA